MAVIVLPLLLLAAVLFFLAAIGVAAKSNLLAWGLFAWVLTQLIPAVTGLHG